MIESETILYQEPGIRVTPSEVSIGRFAYRMVDIASITLKEERPKRNLVFLLFTLGGLALSYFLFNNIYGVLLVAIAMFPSLMWILRPRTIFAVEVLAGGEATQPVRSINEEEVARIVTELNHTLAQKEAAPPAAPDFQVLQTPANNVQQEQTDGFVRTVPKQCARCDQPLTLDNLDWHDLNSAFCPRCRSQVAVTWRKA
jgi:uncharacterized membrane protein YqjE